MTSTVEYTCFLFIFVFFQFSFHEFQPASTRGGFTVKYPYRFNQHLQSTVKYPYEHTKKSLFQRTHISVNRYTKSLGRCHTLGSLSVCDTGGWDTLVSYIGNFGCEGAWR